MRSKNRSIRLPNPLIEAGDRRANDLGYPSFNAYMAALIRYDLMVRGPHHVTLPIARMRLEDQDKIDDRLLEIEQSGQGQRGIFLEHLIERTIANGMPPTGDAIAKTATT